MKKRALALLLALLLIVSCLPMGASAAESWEEIAKKPFQNIQETTDEELTAFDTIVKSEIERLVNEERKKAGVPEFCGAYKNDGGKLIAVGDVRAFEIMYVFSHDRPDGSSWETAFHEVGLKADWKGENIAYYGRIITTANATGDTISANTSIEEIAKMYAKEIVNGWMNSPNHRANILSTNYNDSYTGLGISIYDHSPDVGVPLIEFTCYAAQEFYEYPKSMIPDKEPEPTPEPEPDPYPGTPFTDINSHWGRDYIKWAYEQNLFSGVSESKFAPNQAMNRGMLATVLHRLAGEPTASSSNNFDDVKSGAYYEEAVAWASENGIVSGVGNGKYAPNQNISREQLAAMLYRYASLNGTPPSTGNLSQFNDTDKISAYALEAMNWAVGEGIITGKGDGRLDPKGNATRAEVATMLQRFAE